MNFIHKIPLFFFNIFYPCKIHGKENIQSGANIFVCNHFRAIDCGFIANVYNKDIFFLAKKELFKNKLFAKIIKSYGAIPVDRENPDLKIMLEILKVLKGGHKLVVFPEGTRNKTGTTELQEMKSGSMIFAVKAKCPITPMMLSGKARIFRKTHIIIGKPFELEEFYNKKVDSSDIIKMENIVRDKMLEQQDILLNNILKRKRKK